MIDLPRGPWLHYKGGRYVLIFVAETHEHNGDLDVVYVSLTHGKAVTRPLTQDSRKQDSWDDVVEWPDRSRRQRFTLESELSRFEIAELQRKWRGQT